MKVSNWHESLSMGKKNLEPFFKEFIHQSYRHEMHKITILIRNNI